MPVKKKRRVIIITLCANANEPYFVTFSIMLTLSYCCGHHKQTNVKNNVNFFVYLNTVDDLNKHHTRTVYLAVVFNYSIYSYFRLETTSRPFVQ